MLRQGAVSNRGMDVPDLFSDDVELCGEHIRLISHRDGPDLNSKPHLKASTGLDCAEELVRECRGGEEG